MNYKRHKVRFYSKPANSWFGILWGMFKVLKYFSSMEVEMVTLRADELTIVWWEDKDEA